MDTCPHCGSPGSFADAKDGRCPVCGMALPLESALTDFSAEASPTTTVPASLTLQPTPVASGEKATIAFTPGPPGREDDTQSPKGIDLIKPRELSPEYARRVTAAWQNTRSQFVDPQETIKSDKAGDFDGGELNIGARLVGPVEEEGTKDYELKEVIGEGAMGTVWSARQSSLNRDVAIKMPKGSAKTEAGRRQFMSEVVVTGQLDHPNIVPIYELGRDAAGELFYSMKRVEGRPWNEILENQELNQQENLEILMKVCDAIRFAHDRGVIHRDIKPHNIMVGQYGEVAVMDWGIALRLDASPKLNSITRISPAGTPAYMAPEMATGSAGAIGPATDVYLLGAVLYEILTGEPPHPAPEDSHDQRELLTNALLIAARNEITPIGQEGELADIVYKSLATEVDNRYQTVREFQDAVRQYYSHAESINLTERGEELLKRARSNGHAHHNGADRFDDFDRARFAFEEAIAVWPGNKRAHVLQGEALLAYANYAYDEGAYARGIALLSNDVPEHKDLLRKLRSARRRTESLSLLLKAAVVLIIVGGSAFLFFLYRAWSETDAQRLVAETQRQAAEAAEKVAKENEEEAKKQEALAEQNAIQATKNAEEANKQREIADQNAKVAMDNAEEAKRQEKIANENAAIAMAKEAEAQAASYAFEIGLAAEELQRNAFDRAAEILVSQTENQSKRPLRNWEWGYLNALVSLDAKAFDDNGKLLQGRVEATAISDNKEWVVAGTSEGDLYVWRYDRSDKPIRLHYGEFVSAVAVTDDGSMVLAAGRSSGERHPVKVWSLPAQEGARPVRELNPHGAAILSLDLSDDGSTVLTSAADGTAGVASLEQTADFKSFVATSQENSIWSARFSPDDQWIVTAGEDGTVRIWKSTLEASSDGSVREFIRFEGHEGPVYAAEFAPDGKYVVSGGRDRKLLAIPFDAVNAAAAYSPTEVVQQRLSNKEDSLSESNAVPLGEHDAAIRSIAFATNGAVLFTAGNDHTIRVWSTQQGRSDVRLLKTLRGHGGWVRSCMAVANDPQHVLSGGYDRRVRVWNWEQYAFPLVLRNESSRSLGDLQLTAGAASPDGRWVASASSTGIVTTWDLINPLDPKALELAEGHDWQATTGIYFDGGRRLLTAGGDNTALVWDEARGNEILRIGGWNAPAGAGWRGVAAISSDGKLIATGAQGDTLGRVWNAETGELVASITSAATERGEESREATALSFTPDGGALVIGDQEGGCTICLASAAWQPTSFQAHPSKISAIKFFSDESAFLTASYDGTVQEWMFNGQHVEPRSAFHHTDRVVAMDLSKDGNTIITAAGSDDEEAVLRIWDRSQTQRPQYSLKLEQIGGVSSTNGGKEIMVRSVALHPNERRALVTIFDPQTSNYRIASWDWTAASNVYHPVGGGAIRDLSTAVFAPHRGEAILTVGGRGARLQLLGANAKTVAMSYRPQGAVRSLCFSPDGTKLVSASDDGSLKIWALDQDNWQWAPEAKIVSGHDGPITSVTFHPTRSDLFLTASDDGTVKLWQANDNSWRVTSTLSADAGENTGLHDVEFVPSVGENLRIAAVGKAGAYIWDTPESAARRFDGVDSGRCLTVTTDGKWMVIGSGSNAYLFDAVTLEPVGLPLTGHSADVTAAAFTPDGTRLFTTSRDFTVKLWDAKAWLGEPGQTSQQRELLTLEGHSDEVTSVVAIAGKGHTFALTTALDGQTIIWPNEPPAP